MMRKSRGETKDQLVAIEIDISKVDILVLRSQAPVIGQRVLQATAHHPASVCISSIATLAECWANAYKSNFLRVSQISQRKTARHIRKPSSESVSNSRPHCEQVMGLERTTNMKRRYQGNEDITRIG